MLTIVKTFVLLSILLLPTSAMLADDAARKAEEDDIHEAVFRHQMTRHDASLFFLGIKADFQARNVDPAPEFLGRLDDLSISVQNCSSATCSPGSAPTDAITGKPGAMLLAGNVQWLSDALVVVHCRSYAG